MGTNFEPYIIVGGSEKRASGKLGTTGHNGAQWATMGQRATANWTNVLQAGECVGEWGMGVGEVDGEGGVVVKPFSVQKPKGR